VDVKQKKTSNNDHIAKSTAKAKHNLYQYR